MPYIYFFVLLFFLLVFASSITWQLYKLLGLNIFFQISTPSLIHSSEMSQLFGRLKSLSNKKLWFDAILLLESQSCVPIERLHNYFNTVGVIYQNMKQYDLARLYLLMSLLKKKDYSVALNNLDKLSN